MMKNSSNYFPISAALPESNITEQYRKIRSNIELSNIDLKVKSIAVTSSMNEEGKTITTLNLATLYAQAGEKTLVIDLDLRKPKVHRGFEIANVNGISDLVVKDLALSECVKVVMPNLHILNAGTKINYPSEFLLSEKLRNTIESLKGQYDKIIIDTPPVHLVTDASIISNFVDGVILIVSSRKTKSEIIKDDIKTLTNNGANILGIVLTRVRKNDFGHSKYYYNYYNDEAEPEKKRFFSKQKR